MHRQKLTKKERRRIVWKKGGGVCSHCGNMVYGTKTVDHVVPRCMGGGSTLANLMPVCKRCNMARGAKWVNPWIYYKYASEDTIIECVAYMRRFYSLRKSRDYYN